MAHIVQGRQSACNAAFPRVAPHVAY